MPSVPTDRARPAWWLAGVLVAVLATTLWWPATPREAVVLAPAALRPAVSAPAAVTPPNSSPAPLPRPELKLVGTVITGNGGVATVRLGADAQVVQLRVGDRVEGLVVTAIEADRIALGGAAQPIVIQADRPQAAPPPPVASPAAGPARAASAEQPAYAEGEAPWDLAPPFRH